MRKGSDHERRGFRERRSTYWRASFAHDGNENLRRTDLAGKPVNDHRHRVAGVIDKQLVAADVSLPHG
jgi:hypothetical protein